jgi:Spy/CpxP family protein refolding chaperone
VLEIKETDHVLLRIIPHRNTLNSSNRRLWRVLHELLAVKDPWLARLSHEGRRWVYRVRDDIWWVMTLRADVNLSPEQKEKIRGIVTSHRQEIVTAVQPLVKNGRTLRDATIADKTDENAIRAAAADVGKSLGDAAILAARIKAEVHQVLTPEQVQTMQEFRKATDKAVDELMQEMSKEK